ncbi:unnamed protein product [Chrysoparadoxa australica]
MALDDLEYRTGALELGADGSQLTPDTRLDAGHSSNASFAPKPNAVLQESGKGDTEEALPDAARYESASPKNGEAEENSSSDLSPSEEESTWISWFVNLRGNEYFIEVDEDYIQDDFNLTGLSAIVPYYDYALDMILDVEMPVHQGLSEEQQEVVESAAEMLYGLIHARYIVTTRGMAGMADKFQRGAFGRCPRVYCQGQHSLPIGLSDIPCNCTVATYCPRCQDIFHPKSSRQANVDGAYFGTTFSHLFLMTHPDLIPTASRQKYVPRIYGFKINTRSAYYINNNQNFNKDKARDSRRPARRRRKDKDPKS